MGANSCKPLFTKNKKNVFQSGSTLDRVISQASNQDQCFLYKLANYKKGGELIDAYNVGGQMEVEKLIKEQFGVLMYADGKGQIINRSEYLRWKFRDNEQVVLPIEASLSPYDPLAKWEDHEACWQMQYRGSLGETLLHVLIICDTKIHTRLARTLLKCFPKLALDVVEGEEYLGASALHLSIAYANNELVQDLIEAGANVNQRAIGSFFLPRDQQRLTPAKNTDYEGLAYLGEYPLAWAACCSNESVYNLLLDVGADPDLQDNFGNMILHMVVVGDKLDMFGYALRHPKIPASNGIVNRAGLTPLTLACTLGRAEVFKEMLELSCKEFWRYSNITCSAYPLNALDTLLPNGSTNYNSALFIILNGTKQEHLDMLDGGIIQRLLEEKWKTFARNKFLKKLFILFVHLLCLSIAVYLRPEDPEEPLMLLPTNDFQHIVRYTFEAATILSVLSYLIFQQGDEIKNQGLWTFLKQQTNNPAKLIFLISNFLILACIPYRLNDDRNTEEAILLFAVPGSWFLLMFFAGAVRLTGPFVTMIYSMITGDMLTFGIIYTIVLFGFSQSFYFLYKTFPGVQTSLYSSYSSTWMALFQITLGTYDYSELASTTYPVVSKSVFALFMVFVPILLLNMLIAMMGNTYAHVIEQSEKEWVKQWAKIVVSLERAVPRADAHKYLQEYSLSLGASDPKDPTTEVRGVMVIKSKSKTRAKQRKGALSNWKRVGKVTINELRKRGITGEDLHALMWGRASISTPIKTKGPALDSQAPNITGGFGEALSSTLDVMAYTHEMNIPPTPGLNLTSSTTLATEQVKIKNQVKTAKEAQAPQSLKSTASIPLKQNKGIASVSKPEATSDKTLDTASEVKEVQIPKPIQPTIAPKSSKTTLETSLDPMRDLVMFSMKKEPPEEKLKAFAKQASNLNKNIEEITMQSTKQVKDLAVMFPGTEAFVKKEEENAKTKKKYSALDPSDSDDFAGVEPLLGKVSRTRRAKSAILRNTSARSKSSDRRKLLIESESSSSDSVINMSFEDSEKTDDDYALERIKLIRESLVSNQLPNLIFEHMRPVNIDVALGKESIPIKEKQNIEIDNDLPEQDSKQKKKRPKTAKTNRVAPTVDVEERGCKSANKVSDESDTPSSPPDPLEPWSMKGITNMNTILAWENQEDDM